MDFSNVAADEFNDRYDTEHGFETITRSRLYCRFVPSLALPKPGKPKHGYRYHMANHFRVSDHFRRVTTLWQKRL